MMHPLAAHVCQIHHRAGFVLALGHGVLGRNASGGYVTLVLRKRPAAWWQQVSLHSLPTLSLDHPAIAHKQVAAPAAVLGLSEPPCRRGWVM
jgi:hypothetical protein